jgi:hypothetical protein
MAAVRLCKKHGRLCRVIHKFFYMEMEIVNIVICGIYAAKESILRGLIEKIEGRPAVLSDAENFVLVKYPPYFCENRERVIYRDIHLGDIEVDMAEKFVKFIPIVE